MNKKVSLNSDKGILTVGDVETRLTNKEFDLFRELHDNIGSTVNRSIVLKKIWLKDDYHSARSMDVYISRLRKLLEGSEFKIESIHGVGHKLIKTE